MATSGTTTWNPLESDIINKALRKIGVLGDYQTLGTSDVMYTNARFMLNAMLKQFATDGMPLWSIKELIIPFSAFAGTNKVSVGPTQTIATDKPLKIVQAWRRDNISNIDIQITVYSYQEYNALTNKTVQTGVPIFIALNPGNTTSSIYTYLIPDTYWSTNGSLVIRYQKEFDDSDTDTENLDFPSYWTLALIYNLATILAPEYGVPLNDRQLLAAEARQFKEAALGYGNDDGSFFFQVSRR